MTGKKQPKRQISIRIDAVTAQQLEELTALDNSTQTMVIARALDRYHKERTETMTVVQHIPGNYVNVFLTDDEMAQLDDGQDFYDPGDDVTLGGYVPEDGENSGIDISINGRTTDNWTTWSELPANIRDRMR